MSIDWNQACGIFLSVGWVIFVGIPYMKRDWRERKK